MEAAFENKLAVTVLAILLEAKFAAVVINYTSGGSGGLFSPVLFLGGMLGALVGIAFADLQHLLPWIPAFPADARVIGACVLLGMGAMFAAVVRCPFTSLIIIFEMTGNYSLILPLMAGNMLAWQIARRLQPVGIYDALLLQDGISLRKLPAYRGAQDYRKLPVQVIMTHDVTVLRESEPPASALRRTAGDGQIFRTYPVLDVAGNVVAVISRRDLESHRDATEIHSILHERPLVAVTTETPIRDAAQRMITHQVRQVPVVSPANSGKLLGWLTLNDIVRQQNAVEA